MWKWFHRSSMMTRTIIGFLGFILIGTILLSLPISLEPGKTISWTDALFTATSAVCVTGLIVVDTPEHFSFFGEFVILLLFQIGGLGIILASTVVLLGIRNSLSLQHRLSLQENFKGWEFGRIQKALRRVIRWFFCVEIAGAVILSLAFYRSMQWSDAVWQGVFHAVSAICNAGFSVRSNSLVDFANDPAVIVPVMILIIFGGLGFVVIAEILQWKQIHSLSIHTKSIFWGSLGFIAGGTLVFALLENATFWEYLFQSVTARTAGFHSVDLTAWGTASILGFFLMMFVGAGPGSTAGGIKLTSLFVVLADFWRRLRRGKNVHWMHRRLSNSLVNESLVLVSLGVMIVGAMTFLLAVVEPFSLQKITFEVFSALGTVGLSLGITPELSMIGKFVIIICMFLGRLGPLTFAYLVISRTEERYTYPEEDIMIG